MKARPTNPNLSALIGLSLLTLCSTQAIGQTTTLLTFINNVQATDGINPAGSSLGPYYSGSVFDFTGVGTSGGTSIDARITATAFGSGYIFAGHLPNYSQNVAGQPAGDAGIVYEATQGNSSGGLIYKIDFYQGGSNFSTPFSIPQSRIMIYDVDGEATQSEAVRAYASDGLMSYQVGNTAQALTATITPNNVLFQGPGVNFPETDASGAAILLYQNTSSITLQFEANTASNSPLPNGVFAGIDGDLSMLGGNESGFAAPVALPEPSSALLAGISLALGILRRKRR